MMAALTSHRPNPRRISRYGGRLKRRIHRSRQYLSSRVGLLVVTIA